MPGTLLLSGSGQRGTESLGRLSECRESFTTTGPGNEMAPGVRGAHPQFPQGEMQLLILL